MRAVRSGALNEHADRCVLTGFLDELLPIYNCFNNFCSWYFICASVDVDWVKDLACFVEHWHWFKENVRCEGRRDDVDQNEWVEPADMIADDCWCLFDFFVFRLVSRSKVVRIVNILVLHLGCHARKEYARPTTCSINIFDQSFTTAIRHRSFIEVMAETEKT